MKTLGKESMITLTSASLSSAHPLVLVLVWPRSLAVTSIMIEMLAAVLKPKVWLSHHKDRSPFGSKASTHTFAS